MSEPRKITLWFRQHKVHRWFRVWHWAGDDLDCRCGHGWELHDAEAIPPLCMVCGDMVRCRRAAGEYVPGPEFTECIRDECPAFHVGWGDRKYFQHRGAPLGVHTTPPCGSCGEPSIHRIKLHGEPMPVCLRHLNHWRTPVPVAAVPGLGDAEGQYVNPDVQQYPDRDLIGLARNIVNQILDESGASVEKRQAINDRCDEFVHGLLAARDAAVARAASEKAWDEGHKAGYQAARVDDFRDHNPYRADRVGREGDAG